MGIRPTRPPKGVLITVMDHAPTRLAPDQPPANLDALFRPNAVAIVGASEGTRKYGNCIAIQRLKGWRPLHLVSRTRPRVLGRPTIPSVSALASKST